MLVQTSFRWDGRSISWRGKASHQLPSDLIRYQEIISEKRPDLIIETGSGEGGTTSFLCDVCSLVGHGLAIGTEKSLEDVEFFSRIVANKSVMVILDSDVYNKDHMLREIRAYALLVSKGQYLVMCHTDRVDWGAKSALDDFLACDVLGFEIQDAPTPSLCSYLLRRG